MDELKLSARLCAVAGLVHKGFKVADIGTDHGYLPIYLVQNGISDFVYACDVRPKPLERAKAHIMEYGLEQNIKICLADGLAGINKGDADTITICGMGGKLMQNIIQLGKDKLADGMQLVLSPQSEVRDFREYLINNNIEIVSELMVKDEGKYYFLMDCIYHKENNTFLKYSETELRYGKKLIESKTEVFKEYLDKEYNTLNQLKTNLLQNEPSLSVEKRLKEINEDMHFNREAYISCGY